MSPHHYVLLATGQRSDSFVPTVEHGMRESQYEPDTVQTAPNGQRIFLRVEFTADAPLDIVWVRFGQIVGNYGLEWTIRSRTRPRRLLIMASKQEHCLADLLARWDHHLLGGDIATVVSNHPDAGDMAATYGVPFRYLPVTGDKTAAEAELLGVLAMYQPDLVVLARYRHLLGPEVCRRLEGRAITVHPSLLPAFPGPGAYRQAAERGVKHIGATAHLVTERPDDGPIIAQETRSVAHLPAADAAAYAAIGRDAETAVLADAVRLMCEDRVLVEGNRTVVFR